MFNILIHGRKIQNLQCKWYFYPVFFLFLWCLFFFIPRISLLFWSHGQALSTDDQSSVAFYSYSLSDRVVISPMSGWCGKGSLRVWCHSNLNARLYLSLDSSANTSLIPSSVYGYDTLWATGFPETLHNLGINGITTLSSSVDQSSLAFTKKAKILSEFIPLRDIPAGQKGKLTFRFSIDRSDGGNARLQAIGWKKGSPITFSFYWQGDDHLNESVIGRAKDEMIRIFNSYPDPVDLGDGKESLLSLYQSYTPVRSFHVMDFYRGFQSLSWGLRLGDFPPNFNQKCFSSLGGVCYAKGGVILNKP